MSFYGAFARTLLSRPAPSMVALFWHLTGRRQRALDRLRLSAPQGRHAYRLWIETVEQPEMSLAAAARDMATWEHRPRISVILYAKANPRPGQMEQVLNSLAAQCYADWELVIVQSHDSSPPRGALVPRIVLAPNRARNPAQALAQGVQTASCAHILPLPADTILPPTALYRYACAIRANPEATVFYGDQDQISSRGRRANGWFKPEWNPELFLAQDYVSAACVIRRDAALAALPIHPALADAASYAMVCALSAKPSAQIVHIPHILAHTTGDMTIGDQATRAAVVARHLTSMGVLTRPGPYGSVELDWPLPARLPLVSIIITVGAGVGLKPLTTCVEAVLRTTSYGNIEVLIVDNGNRDPETLSFLEHIASNPKVRVLRHEQTNNVSALTNFAASQARGDYLCLLGNTMEPGDANWLTALMRQAIRPRIGAAGAKILYEDDTIHHAGITIGIGQGAGHAHRFQPDAEPGYFARAHVAHYVSAVTAACLLVAKAKFFAVGGFDEQAFAASFNDVDFCLRLEQADFRNVYVPQARLLANEAKTSASPAPAGRQTSELAELQARWHTRRYADPLHHPQLDRASENYLIRLAPEPEAAPHG